MAAKSYVATLTENGKSVRAKFMLVNVREEMTDPEAVKLYEQLHGGIKVSDIKFAGDMTQEQLNESMKQIPGFSEEKPA